MHDMLIAEIMQLMIPTLEGYCGQFLAACLNTCNCVGFLRESVHHSMHDMHTVCVAMVAQGEQAGCLSRLYAQPDLHLPQGAPEPTLLDSTSMTTKPCTIQTHATPQTGFLWLDS